MLYVPRNLKTRPGAPQTHLAYITPDEEKILQQYKPGTPHGGPEGIPNYDTWAWSGDPSDPVTGGSTADGGGAWSGDVTGEQQSEPEPWSGSGSGNVVNDINEVIGNPVTVDTATTLNNPTDLDDDIWNLAVQAYASNPGYAKSWEGKKFIEQLAGKGITEGDPRYEQAMVQAFGLPKIIGTTSHYRDKEGRIIKLGDPITTAGYTDEYGQKIQGGKPIMTGQGKYLMDQYDEPETYEEKVDAYYKMREEQQAQQTGSGHGYGYNYPSYRTVSGGYGYGFGDPADIGKTHWDYGEPYSEARYGTDPMMKFMVDTHSPMYAARGGIMNLRR